MLGSYGLYAPGKFELTAVQCTVPGYVPVPVLNLVRTHCPASVGAAVIHTTKFSTSALGYGPYPWINGRSTGTIIRTGVRPY